MIDILHASRPHIVAAGKISLACAAGGMFVLFCFFVVDELFAALAVAAGFLSGDLYDVEDVGCFAEDGVHFFEGSVCRLGIEEINHWEDECVSGVIY